MDTSMVSPVSDIFLPINKYFCMTLNGSEFCDRFCAGFRDSETSLSSGVCIYTLKKYTTRVEQIKHVCQ